MTLFTRIAGILLAGLIGAAVPAGAEEIGGPDLLPALDRVAAVRSREGTLAAAERLRRQALAITVAAFGCDSPQAAEAMTSLALVDIDRGRWLDAEPLLIVADRLLAGAGARSARVLAGLSRVAAARGEARRAVLRAQQAVAADPHSAVALRALGMALGTEERFDEAEPVLRQALAEAQSRQGDAAPETARSLAQLGNLYLRQGKAAEALALIEQATAIDQALLGPAHPFIADDLHDLGIAYDALQRPHEAEKAFAAALAVLERGDGRNTPRVAYLEQEQSRLYRQRGDSEAAEAASRDARRILNKEEAEERRRERKV